MLRRLSADNQIHCKDYASARHTVVAVHGTLRDDTRPRRRVDPTEEAGGSATYRHLVAQGFWRPSEVAVKRQWRL